MRQMNLVMYKMAGPASHLWKHPAEHNEFLDPDHWDAVAQELEAARFDAIFLADSLAFYDDDAIRGGGELYLLDPLPLAMSIARGTRHLGIGVTISTSFVEPYNLARALGSTDVLSGGRIAWNVVTSTIDKAAHHFGKPGLLGRSERYDRAEEVLEASARLWESFNRDAMVMDKNAGVFIDPSKLRPFDYAGKHVKLRGPLTTPSSPQGRPVIIQAGSSERGREFAARWAEMIFTTEKQLGRLQAFYKDMKSRVVTHGRKPEDCSILMGLAVTVGETEAIAREKLEFANSLMSDELAINIASKHTGIDLTRYPKDGPMPVVEEMVGSLGVYQDLLALSQDLGLTIVEICRRYAGADSTTTVVGTPEHVADQMQHLFEEFGTDGFMLRPNGGPSGASDFCRMVVPILQERGIFRTEYPGTTLRDTLGLSKSAQSQPA